VNVARPPRAGPRDWPWFAVWAAIGAGLGVAFVSFGPLALVLVLIAAVVLIVRRRLSRATWGLLSGLGVVALLIAYVQRKGPGTVYWHTATASGADTYLDPRPWLAAGVVLGAAGIAAFAFSGRRVHHETRHRGRGGRGAD